MDLGLVGKNGGGPKQIRSPPPTTIAMNEPVPVLPLGDIYSSHTISHQTPRYLELENNFEKKFSSKPQFIARAPGRVNMIGECV